MQDDSSNNAAIQLPAEVAYRKMRERIERDESLPDNIKKAVLDDLTGATPARFPLLRKILTPQSKSDEADGAKGE